MPESTLRDLLRDAEADNRGLRLLLTDARAEVERLRPETRAAIADFYRLRELLYARAADDAFYCRGCEYEIACGHESGCPVAWFEEER